jgi:hypothetical protein
MLVDTLDHERFGLIVGDYRVNICSGPRHGREPADRQGFLSKRLTTEDAHVGAVVRVTDPRIQP